MDEIRDEVVHLPDSVDLLAASMRYDASDIESFISSVAARMGSLFPSNTEVHLKRRSLLSKEKGVESVTVTFDDNLFALDCRSGRVVAKYSQRVRGIVLKSIELPVSEWVEKLVHVAAIEAEKVGKDRTALAKLLGIE